MLLQANIQVMFVPSMQITPDILREIDKSRSRGEKEDDAMSIDILSLMVLIFQLELNLVYLCCHLLFPYHRGVLNVVKNCGRYKKSLNLLR